MLRNDIPKMFYQQWQGKEFYYKSIYKYVYKVVGQLNPAENLITYIHTCMYDTEYLQIPNVT